MERGKLEEQEHGVERVKVKNVFQGGQLTRYGHNQELTLELATWKSLVVLTSAVPLE